MKRLALAALSVLVFCSCRAPCGPSAVARSGGDPGYATAAMRAGGQGPMLPDAAYTDANAATAALSGSPGMESGAPLPYSPEGPWAPPGLTRPWPEDEYLRDGGDANHPAGVRSDWAVLGLDMEDTVAHYETLDGRTLVEPSNRVYLYSPRFGAVRQVVGLMANEERLRPGGVFNPTAPEAPTTTQLVAKTKQHIQPNNQIGARPPLALRTKQARDVFSSAIGPRGFQDAFKPYENLAIIRQGKMEGSEKALLAQGSNAAIAWTHTQAVQIILDHAAAMADVKYDNALSVYTVENPPGNPKLRVVKVASTPFAEPGDEVDFTIRFDNVGNQVIGNVTIVDSLNTRLEYIPDSAQCSVKAQFFTQPNEGDSIVLRCEVTDPLEAGQGGVLRFRCRVR